MSSLFGSEKVDLGKKLSSGLAPYAHQLKIGDGDVVRFVPLHETDQCLEIAVHSQAVKYNGRFMQVPVGSKLQKSAGGPISGSPFENDTRKEVRNWKLQRFMLVFVLEGSNALNGHVAFLELRQNMKRTGTYDKFVLFEDQAGDSVEGYIAAYSRTGKGVQDTVYEAVVTPKKYEFKDAEKVRVEAEQAELIEYLRSEYVTKQWTLETLNEIYNSAIVNGVRDENVPAAVEPPKPNSTDESQW